MVTPTARPVDIAQVFPELRSLAKSATRLHPRRGEPQVRDSSIGGPLLWPADEAWPACRLPRRVEHERRDAVRARFERLLTRPGHPGRGQTGPRPVPGHLRHPRGPGGGRAPAGG
jgi:hypothetical protein